MTSDDTEGEASSPISGRLQLRFPSILAPPPSQFHWNRNEDEVEEDIITISSTSGMKSIHAYKLIIESIHFHFR